MNWQKQARGTRAHLMATGGRTVCGRHLWSSWDAPAITPRCQTCTKLAR